MDCRGAQRQGGFTSGLPRSRAEPLSQTRVNLAARGLEQRLSVPQVGTHPARAWGMETVVIPGLPSLPLGLSYSLFILPSMSSCSGMCPVRKKNLL